MEIKTQEQLTNLIKEMENKILNDPETQKDFIDYIHNEVEMTQTEEQIYAVNAIDGLIHQSDKSSKEAFDRAKVFLIESILGNLKAIKSVDYETFQKVRNAKR